MPQKHLSKFSNLTDEELMTLFQNDDEDAFVELMNRHKSKVFNYLYRFFGDRDEADDIAQDSFVKLYEKKDTFRQIGKFSTWFYTIVSNNAKNRLIVIKRDNEFDARDFGDETIVNNEFVTFMNDEINTGNEEIYGISTEEIESAFDILSETNREVIYLRYKHELEYEEISDIVGIPVGTVKSRINRGRFQLKEVLKSKINAGK